MGINFINIGISADENEKNNILNNSILILLPTMNK